MKQRADLKQARRIVIKIGSALLTDDGKGLDQTAIDRWVDEMATLRKQGKEIILVSSGAVAAGMNRLGWSNRPHALHELQAAAAVGQMSLVKAWENSFQRYNLHTALVLLTHDDLTDRKRYLNARSTITTLTTMGVIPVVNENDTVAFDELRLGDNDTLAARVSNAVEADLLILLTDQNGLFTADPRKSTDAKLITEGMADDPQFEDMAGDSGALGQGGMSTKIRAAKLAARCGASTMIASGRTQNIINRVLNGDNIGTLLKPSTDPIPARKRWLAGQLTATGTLTLDQGAAKALTDAGRSLLPIGVTACDGEFQRGELVVCIDSNGDEIARGLINYSSNQTRNIMGFASNELEKQLGFIDEAELIHRDNLTLS